MEADATCADGRAEVLELALDLVAQVLMDARDPVERARLVQLLVDQVCDMSALLDPAAGYHGGLRRLRRAAARHVHRVHRVHRRRPPAR